MAELIGYVHYYGHLFVTGWIDAVWVPIAALAVHRGQRIKAMAFVILCMTVMRLQIAIVKSTGFDLGFTGLWNTSLYHRGLVTYGLFIMVYLVLSYYSPYTRGVIYLAASLSIFFMAFLVSTFVLVI